MGFLFCESVMQGFYAVGYFLFSLSISILIFVLWSRFALRYFRISALLPASQMIIHITNPLVRPINQLFLYAKLKPGRYDWPCLVLITIVELIKFALIGPLFLQGMLPFPLIVLLTAASLITEPCNLLFYAIIIRVIMSWINPSAQHPLYYLIYSITEPILFNIRKRLPQTGGLDFSPLIAVILLKVIPIFISASLPPQLT